jgi:protein-L-isoaspartate(D-aspartate) O-methyltransferase
MATSMPCEADGPEARALRAHLVSYLIESGDLRSEAVRRALLRVPRHLFVPRGEPLEEAYANRPLPIGRGQTISQPAVVAIMTEALALGGDERVLEIGTGSGYQAAVLSELAREVYSVEILADLARTSASRLAELGYANVHVRHGDGAAGWPAHAPFDRILATAAAPAIPDAWMDQLSAGGILVAPVGEEEQRLLRVRKGTPDSIVEDLGPVRFVPVLPDA